MPSRPRASPRPARPLPAAETPPPAPLPTRVTIHYPPSAAAEAERTSAALAAAGVARVGIVPVRLDISRSNVRFYHQRDGASAETVVALIAAGGEPPLARDFTDYKTPAAPGALEIWLAGDSGTASVPRTRPRPAAEAPAEPVPAPPMPVASTFAPSPVTPLPLPTAPPTPPAPQDQAQAVARIIVERAYERLMQALPRN